MTCQGGDYTTQVYSALRQKGWSGYWVDAASTLRMEPEAVVPVQSKRACAVAHDACDTQVIVLDPLNRTLIDQARSLGRGGRKGLMGRGIGASVESRAPVLGCACTQHGMQAITGGIKCFVGGNCTTVALISL